MNYQNNQDNTEIQNELSNQYFNEDYKELSKFEKDEINHLIKVSYS